MPIDPAKREGKGRLPEERSHIPLNDQFVDDTLEQAATQAVIFDYFSMLVSGFWQIITGFFKIEGSAEPKDREKEKS